MPAPSPRPVTWWAAGYLAAAVALLVLDLARRPGRREALEGS